MEKKMKTKKIVASAQVFWLLFKQKNRIDYFGVETNFHWFS